MIIAKKINFNPISMLNNNTLAKNNTAKNPTNLAKNNIRCNYPIGYRPVFKGSSIKQTTQLFSNTLDKVLENPRLLEENKEVLNNSFKKIFNSKIENDKPIGSGKVGKVYRINDKYVFKQPHQDNDLGNIKITNTKFDNFKTYYGYSIAKTGNIEIMKNADSKANAEVAGISYNAHFMNCKNEIKHYNEVYLPKCAHMPQNAFDNLAQDFQTLNKMSQNSPKPSLFDTLNPQNILLLDDEIRLVDEIYESFNPNTLNTIDKMLEGLVIRYNTGIDADFDDKLTPLRKTIIKKCILASEKAGIIAPLDFNSSRSLKKAFKLIGIEDKKNIVFRNITQIRQDNQDITTRMNVLEKYIDKELGVK